MNLSGLALAHRETRLLPSIIALTIGPGNALGCMLSAKQQNVGQGRHDCLKVGFASVSAMQLLRMTMPS
jgi:hypothetical protein